MKKLFLKLKNIIKNFCESKENLLLYLCNGDALPSILSEDEEREYILNKNAKRLLNIK